MALFEFIKCLVRQTVGFITVIKCFTAATHLYSNKKQSCSNKQAIKSIIIFKLVLPFVLRRINEM